MTDQATDATLRGLPRRALVDVLAADGTLVMVDAAEARLLGVEQASDGPLGWTSFYTFDSRDRLRDLFVSPDALPKVLPLGLKLADGRTLAVTAIAEAADDTGRTIRLLKWPSGTELDDLARLSMDNEVLAGIVATSDDAGWCMEWAEPVDLAAPEHEIIRQVFENGPRWRFCNDAMARLYRTPPGEDLNARPVSEIFPRTAENEDFIARLIRAQFDLNATPSRDLRYDGVFIDVENDVRGHIRGNRLYRMWGTVRDVSKHVRREERLRQEISELVGVLGALPSPVLVVSRDGSVQYANLEAEDLFQATSEQIAQCALADLFDGGQALTDILLAAREAHRPLRAPAAVRRAGITEPVSLAARSVRLGGTDCVVFSVERSGARPRPEPRPGFQVAAR